MYQKSNLKNLFKVRNISYVVTTNLKNNKLMFLIEVIKATIKNGQKI